MSSDIPTSNTATKGGLRQGALGSLAITFFVVSAAGPLVAMAGGVPVAMLFGNGSGIATLFLIATLILLTFSVGYTAMAKHVRNAGAFYAFSGRGLGKTAAGAAGMIALLSYNAMQIGLYGLFGTAAKGLVEPLIAVTLPWWFYSVVAMALIACAGYRQVDLSAKILGFLVAGEYLVVMLLDCGIMASGGDAGMTMRPFSYEVASSGAPITGLLLCFAAFIGFEATTIYSEEARDPGKTIPRATYLSVLLMGLFYTVSTWALVNGIGIDKVMPLLTSGDPTTVLFDQAAHYIGPGMVMPMQVLFVTSTFASLLAFHNAVSRYFFAMGREGLLPKGLGVAHARFASPHRGSVTQTVVAAVLLAIFTIGGADPVLVMFTLNSAIATLGIIVLMAMTALATLFFFKRHPELNPGLFTTLCSLVALAGLSGIAGLAVYHFDMLTGGGSAIAPILPLLVLAAAVIGALMANRQSASADTVPDYV